MYITMQGSWSVKVKSKSAAFNQRFIISGATTGNGTYEGKVSTPIVNVTGSHWSIAIQHDPGSGYRASDARIKFPTITGGNYVFDIESNDTGGDQDFNDLILTCSTLAMSDDFIIYGHVKSYHGSCVYNPCYPRYLVIDTYEALHNALKNPIVKEALTQLYPERVLPPVIVDPNPPDPAPFVPMMINMMDLQQIPAKTASIYRKQSGQTEGSKKASKNADASAGSAIKMDALSFEKNVAIDSSLQMEGTRYSYDRLAIASLADKLYLFCQTENVPFETLHFQEYDRTASELAGAPYTGGGNRLNLGYAVTDMNGNYIFRFTQSNYELINEVLHDVAIGENAYVQANPDIIVKIQDPSTSAVLFESAPHFNVPNLKRIDLCFPKSVLNNTQVCLTEGANLIEYVGDVVIGGTQNTTNIPKARSTALNTLRANGKITAHDTTGPIIDCGCWVGRLDLRGCMNNKNAAWYTIRYGKTAGTWQFVTQEYHHQRVSNTNTNSPGTKVGPFQTDLKVDGGSKIQVPAYQNIQAQNLFGGGDWFPANIDILNQLSSSIYEAGSAGTVHFRVDAFDKNGNPITSDMISLYIDNSDVDRKLQDAYFDTSVSTDCVLFTLTNDEISGGTTANPTPLPLKVFFKANHLNGFLDYYLVAMGKGKYNTLFPTTDDPAGRAHGTYKPSLDPGCIGYIGSANEAGMNTGIVEVDFTPTSPNGWLANSEDFCTFAVNLYWRKRCTDGYSLCPGYGPTQFIFGVKRA